MPETLEQRKAMMDEASTMSPRTKEKYMQEARAGSGGLDDDPPENPVIQDQPFKGGK